MAQPESYYDYIIAGAGAAGLLTAQAIAQQGLLRGKKMLIIDRAPKQENDRTWCYWERGTGNLDPVVHHSWSRIAVADQQSKMQIGLGDYRYKMVRSAAFYTQLNAELSTFPEIEFKYESITDIKEGPITALVITTTGKYRSPLILNSAVRSMLFEGQEKYPVLAQHFIGWFVKTAQPVFDPERADFMDFSIEQKGNTRFMYVLPTSSTEALLEYTLFSPTLLSTDEYEDAIRDYLKNLGVEDYEIVDKERGNIPMTSYDFAQEDTEHVYHIGTAGGWTKASSGYTFQRCRTKALSLATTISQGQSIQKLKRKDRFWWYDLILLDVLSKHNERGHEIFGSMFRNNAVDRIFRFLDEQTHLGEELRIFIRMPLLPFSKAAIKRLLGL